MWIIFFLFGLIVGSFVNVVVYRLQIAESFIFGSSKCPKCKAKIKWYDNIPLISFVLLHFRCRNCKEKISWQYPIVELSTGILFALVGVYFFSLSNISSWVNTIYFLFIVSLLLIIFVYDLLYMKIPVSVVWVGVALALVYRIYLDLSVSSGVSSLLDSQVILGVLGAFLAWLFFFALAYGSKEKWMGMGDAYLAIFLGMLLGVSDVFYALIIGFFLGALLGIGLILGKKKKMKSQLPLAPFLIAGTYLMIFWGQDILNWYQGLFL